MFVVSTLDAKFARKMHPVVWKWPQSGPFGAKTAIFWAIRGPRHPRWLAKVDQMVDHS